VQGAEECDPPNVSANCDTDCTWICPPSCTVWGSELSTMCTAQQASVCPSCVVCPQCSCGSTGG
jgi:hypothetical protein